MFQTLIASLSIFILPNLVFAETKIDSSNAAQRSCEAYVDPIITDWSGLDRINWDNITGYGRLKQKSVFNADEIDAIRRLILTSRHYQMHGIEFFYDNYNGAHLIEAAGAQAEKKFSQYINEIYVNIANRTNRKFKLSVKLRSETAPKFENGHFHNPNSLSITRAELGQGSWFRVGNETKKYFESDDATVFTTETHGGQFSPQRLLILIYVEFI